MNDLVRRCARFGWTLRPCDEGWELLGNGPRATWPRLELCREWLDKQDKRVEVEEAIDVVQSSFLEAA